LNKTIQCQGDSTHNWSLRKSKIKSFVWPTSFTPRNDPKIMWRRIYSRDFDLTPKWVKISFPFLFWNMSRAFSSKCHTFDSMWISVQTFGALNTSKGPAKAALRALPINLHIWLQIDWIILLCLYYPKRIVEKTVFKILNS